MAKAPVLLTGLLVGLGAATGCSHDAAMRDIDRRVAQLISESNEATNLSVRPEFGSAAGNIDDDDLYRERPGTVNPRAAELNLRARIDADADAVIQRLDAYAVEPAAALELDLPRAMDVATENSREYIFQEEEYILAALRLLVERHRWGPRFFDDVSATVSANPDDGSYDTALRIVNELGVTQRLPYGGSVSASLLARATEDLHRRVSGENVQSAELLLTANVPLLRGSGQVARESRIQAERELIYAARDFERFRREFLFTIADDFLSLVVQKRRISISEAQVESFRRVESQQIALYEGGRATPFDADEARNETLDAIDSLNDARESFRLSKDRFKVRLGLPTDRAIVIIEDAFELPVPASTLDEAVVAAMTYRLDLQTRRDRVDDRRRSLLVARDELRPDLNLTGRLSLPTDPSRDRSGLQFEPDETDLTLGVTFGLPLDREIERLGVRQAEISLARSEREFDRFRDEVAIAVRAAVRGIDSATFSLQIQETNVEIAEQRKAAIDADPAGANIRQTTDAINAIARARSSRDDARRNLEIAILSFLRDTGQLRVGTDGMIAAIPGGGDRGNRGDRGDSGTPDGEAAPSGTPGG
ncbi:MAG: TolC family protein [Phycisphaerales bacterium]